MRVRIPEKSRALELLAQIASIALNLNMITPLLTLQHLLRRNDPHISLLPIEDPSDILQRQPPCLRVPPPNTSHHRDKHSKEDKVVLPIDRLERDRVDESVEENHGEAGHLRDGEAFSAEFVGPDFDRVGDDQGGEGDVVAEEVAAENFVSDVRCLEDGGCGDLHEEERDDCEPGGGVAGGGEAAGETSDDNVGHQHDDGLGDVSNFFWDKSRKITATHRSHEEQSSTKTLDKQGRGHGPDQVPDLQAC